MKTAKQAISRCYLCGASASEVILERVKKAPGVYVCEYCEQDHDQYGYKSIIRKKFGDELANTFDPYTPADNEKASPFEEEDHEEE